MTRILTTERLLLRPARPDDLHALHAIFSNPAAMRYWSHPEHEDIARTRETLQALLDTPSEWVVTRDGEAIGKAGAWRAWEVGYMLHPGHWGLGLATEAMRAVVGELFCGFGAQTLTAETDPRNLPSIRVLNRLGFVETHAASRTLQWRDEWCDSLYFALERTAFDSRPFGA
jgi:RimJ/RimL family protein N-acetyltransferase